MSADTQPFGECIAPNATWSADFKGQFLLSNQKFCYPLTITDNFSRFLFCCLGGISKLSKWWIDLGIRSERIKPSHPKQNGRHERMHRSLKAALQPQNSFEAQQTFFNQFLREYNEERSHEGIGRKTPAECYEPSKRIYTGHI